MASSDTRTEQYLGVAAHGNRADLPTATCCETRTQTLVREVAERIITEEETRAAADRVLQGEIDEIRNNPDVVDIVATYAALQAYDTTHLTDKDVIRVLADENHNDESTYYRWSTTTQTWTYIGESKQYSDFVGTDGTTAGESGLVPAPATTDAGKFLKADGTWGEAGGGGGEIIELTSSDYDWPTSSPDGIALWLLDPGTYHIASSASLYITTSIKQAAYSGGYAVVFEKGGYVQLVTNQGVLSSHTQTTTGGYMATTGKVVNVTNNLGTSTSEVMNQNATTNMVYADTSRYSIKIGTDASVPSSGSVRGEVALGYTAKVTAAMGVAIGRYSRAAGQSVGIGGGANNGQGAEATGTASVSIGFDTTASAMGSVAIGAGALAATQGEVNIGVSTSEGSYYGYDGSNYRLLTGLYDGQSAHDAATYGQLSTAILNGGTTAPTTATVGAVGTLYSYVDTTGTPTPHLMVCTAVTDVSGTIEYTWVDLMGSVSASLQTLISGSGATGA